jgi:hypothetical protein
VIAEGDGSDKNSMPVDEGGKGLLGAGLHVFRQQLVVIDLCHLQMYTSPKGETETFIFDKPKKSLHKPPARGTIKSIRSLCSHLGARNTIHSLRRGNSARAVIPGNVAP